MQKKERLTYVLGDSSVEFSARKTVTPFWWNTEDGLTQLSVDIYTVKGSGQDGESFVSASLPARSITIEGQITRNPETNRRKLLSIVDPKRMGRLVYENAGFVAYIPCCVKTLPHFSRGLLPNFQIEFFCPSPYWREGNGDSPNVVDVALWMPMLEFPVDIPAEGMEFEIRSPSLIVNVPNNGSVDAGMTAVFRATAATSNPSLINVETQETLSLTIDMVAGDEIRVLTGYGEKGAWLKRGGVTTNIFNQVDADSVWLQLHTGDNLIRYDATETDNLMVSIYYEHYLRGV